MPEPLTAPGRVGAPRAARPERSPWRRAGLWALITIVSYGLTLSVASDSFYLLAMPGLIGLMTVVIIGVQKFLHRSFGVAVPYATDGTDRRAVVRYHYVTLLKRYLTIVLVAAAFITVPLVADVAYLYPLIGVGILCFKIGTYLFLGQILLVRKCSRVLNVYDFEFRAPVQTYTRQSRGRRYLRVGERPLRSPKMSARAPVNEDWPTNIQDGVWFAGDDAFGGVLLVPGSGEVMCMQPLDWGAGQDERAQAGTERTAKAENAGLAKHSL